jgi:hypothetical protein
MTLWADPDVDEAAAWIRRLLADPDLRRSIGQAAAADMRTYNADAVQARFLDEILAIRDSRAMLGIERVDRKRDVLPEEIRTGRLARIQELERELDWIKSRPFYRFATATKTLLRRLRPQRERAASPRS